MSHKGISLFKRNISGCKCMKNTPNHQIIHRFFHENIKILIFVKRMLSKYDYLRQNNTYISAV